MFVCFGFGGRGGGGGGELRCRWHRKFNIPRKHDILEPITQVNLAFHQGIYYLSFDGSDLSAHWMTENGEMIVCKLMSPALALDNRKGYLTLAPPAGVAILTINKDRQ